MRALDVDQLTKELQQQTVTIAGTVFRLVVKDNEVTRRLRDDSRQLTRLGRKADELAAETKRLDDADQADEGAFDAIAKREDDLEEEVVGVRRRMIAQLIRDDKGVPPAAEVLDGLDSAVIGRLFEFVLSDPLADQPDPTPATANGGGTPPTS